jgi:hypothetical protein
MPADDRGGISRNFSLRKIPRDIYASREPEENSHGLTTTIVCPQVHVDDGKVDR